MSKPKSVLAEEKRAPLFSVRFVIALLLIIGGIAWTTYYYATFGGSPVVPGKPKAIADLGLWNYAIGFGGILVGLVVAADPSTPLGRGRGVVVGMLGCFLIGLVWICTYYIFSTPEDLAKIWVFNDLNQLNLVVGIAFMAVGFSFATKWE